MRERISLGLPVSLALTGLAGGVLAYAHWVERAKVQLDRFEVLVDKPGLPASGLVILHLSDFHFRANDAVQTRRLEHLLAQLRGQRYDVLALTGDLIHDQAGLAAALPFLRELHPRIAAFTVPGNREYWQSSFRAILGSREELREYGLLRQAGRVAGGVRRVVRMFALNERATLGVQRNDVAEVHGPLAELGVVPLVNRSVRVRCRDIDATFAGVDDLNRGEPDLAAALADAAPDRPLILLAHNPDAWLEPPAGRADLVLSGHTHGGQIRLPLIGAWYRQGTHLPRGQAAGWFERGDSALFVTRGLGESFPFRLGARPQAALIRLMPRDPRPRDKRRMA